MKIRWHKLLITLFISFVCLAAFTKEKKYNVGLLIVATGKYIQFVEPLIKSADTHFCKNQKVTYFVFTDGNLPHRNDIVIIEQKRLGWPYDTMMRLSIYDQHKDILQKMDYLFATDADMLFVGEVGDEILSDRVATQHPGYVGKRGTYETRKESTAYVASREGKYYFAGGFNGGTAKEFLKLAEVTTKNIKIDLEKNIIAVWHDESHINRYFIDNSPTCILNPSYCYPGNDTMYKRMWKETYPRKLVALDKNHKEIRE